MADTERTLLEHYNLPNLFPTEWPAEKDEADEHADEGFESEGPTKTRPKYKSLAPGVSLKSGSGRSQIQRDAVGITQKDEPDPLGDSDSVVQALRRRGQPVEDNLELRNRFLLSSTSFNPSLYLAEIHNDDTTEDLLAGLEFLSQSIEKKSASLKVLVESNFERFVRAKATIDNVYTEMRSHGEDPNSTPQRHSRQTSRSSFHNRKISGQRTSGAFGNRLVVNEKRKNALVKESEYGVLGIKAPLSDATTKAKEVWGPALGGRDREESLRAVLSCIEGNREMLERGKNINDHIRQKDYKALAEEYARVQGYVNEAKATVDRSTTNGTKLNDQQVYQVILTARIWMDIEQRISQFKKDTRTTLNSSFPRNAPSLVRGTETDPTELIAVLIQIGVEENPISSWLLNWSSYLSNKISTVSHRCRIELEILRRRLASSKAPTPKRLAIYLKVCSNPKAKDDLTLTDTISIIRFWEKLASTLDTILSPRDGMLGEVIEFWEMALSYINGNKQRGLPIGADGRGRQHHQLPKDTVRELENVTISLLGQIRDQISGIFVDGPLNDLASMFSPIPMTPQSATLSPSVNSFNINRDDIPPPSPKAGEFWEGSAFWPPYSNSNCAGSYLGRLANTIASAAAEMAAIPLARQNTQLISQLRALVSDVRERSISALCASWVADSEKCRDLEDWVKSPEKRDVTNLPARLFAFQSNMLAHLQKIVYLTEARGGPGASDVLLPPPNRHTETVSKAFKVSVFKTFNEIMENATGQQLRDSGPAEDDIDISASHTLMSRGIALDATDGRVRKLLTLVNIHALRTDYIPTLVSQFESDFVLTISADSKSIRDTLEQLSRKVFRSYSRQTNEKLEQLISRGVAEQAPALGSRGKPTDARAYIYDVLLVLVVVHNEVLHTTPTLINQMLSLLLEQASSCLLAAFENRSPENPNGNPITYDLKALIQATLDVEFLAQTLNNYTTEKASEIQGKIYLALDERTDNDARMNLQSELPEMRAVLKRLREATQGEFKCFKKDRSSRRDKDRRPDTGREGTPQKGEGA